MNPATPHELPDGLPELLVTLAHELRLRLAQLVPELSAQQRSALVAVLMSSGAGAWGNEFPVAAKFDAPDLPHADPVYAVLYAAWCDVLAVHLSCHSADWRHVAACQLLDVARGLLGGLYVPKGHSARAQRDRRMYEMFVGNYRAVAMAAGVTDRRARQIIDHQRRAELRARQRDLFE